MLTRLPYPSFAHSVAVLDRASLGRQRLECAQMISALRLSAVGQDPAWGRHPGVDMWRGHLPALCVYASMAVHEWAARGYTGATVAPYGADWTLSPAWRSDWTLSPAWWCVGASDIQTHDARQVTAPPWLGEERLHLSHRRALMYKLPEHYRDFEWRVVPRLDYWWPTEEKTA